jgi:patatin-like phospholipase/acyl hydrolase
MKKYIVVAFALIAVMEINAQNAEKNRTGESVGQQLKNNKVPGLQYAPAQSSAPAQVQPHTSMVEDIKSGKYGKVQTGGVSAPAPAVAARSANQKLASDQSTSQAEQSGQKTQKMPGITIPSQGNVSEEAAAPAKATPANELKRLPVKKDQQ